MKNSESKYPLIAFRLNREMIRSLKDKAKQEKVSTNKMLKIILIEALSLSSNHNNKKGENRHAEYNK